MSKLLAAFAAVMCLACLTARAEWGVADTGLWPETWPQELEPLRDQSRTLNGSLADLTFYEIKFNSREEFEAAWPHILAVRTEGVPITLFRGPHEYLGTLNAGVRIWDPVYEDRGIWLVVDGEIVDLNRIPLPEGTVIIDRRFEEAESE
jgi:hypothetical protein